MLELTAGEPRGAAISGHAGRKADTLALCIASLRLLVTLTQDAFPTAMVERLERGLRFRWRVHGRRLAHREVVHGNELAAASAEQTKRCNYRGGRAWVLLFTLFGCRSVVDADAYSVGEGGAAGEALLDPLSWTPTTCPACADRSCGELLSGCREDEACADAAACFAEAPSPAQRLRCSLRNPSGHLAMTALYRCLATQCATACRGEAAWGCLGDDTLVTEPPQSPLTLSVSYAHIQSEAPLPGLTVGVCERGDANQPCAETLASAETDDDGTALLRIDDASGVRAPFLYTTGDDFYPELRFSSTPVLIDTVARMSGVTRDAFAAISFALGSPETEGHASLSVTAFDCVGAPAAGLAIEVTPTDELSRAFYSKGQVDLDSSLTETQTDGIMVYANLPVGPVTVRATDVATGRVVSEHEVIIAEGARTTLALEPRVDRP